MAEVFGNQNKIRGCFIVHRLAPGSSRGAQLVLPAGGLLPTDDLKTDPLLCIGFDCNMAETVLFNKCFGGRVYTYAFGHDPNTSVVNVNLLGFLISPTGYSKVADQVMKAYDASRTSKSRKFALLQIGKTKPLRGFVVGVSSTTVDPQYSLQSFTVKLACPSL